MTKLTRKSVLCAILCAFFVLFCTSCSNGGEKIRVAVIVKATDSDFWHSVKKGAESAATEYNVEMTFEGPENEEDYNAQNALIQKAAASGADAVVLSAIDSEKSLSVLSEAVKNGIKIIAIDSDSAFSQTDMFIGTDNISAGKEAAKEAVKGFAPESEIRIGIVNCYESADNAVKRENGFKEYIKTIPGAQIAASVNVDSNLKSAVSGAKKLLAENPQINVLAGFNEWATLGVGGAVKELDLSKKVKAIGFDSNPVSIGMLETGEMDALVVQNPFAIGYLGVQNASLAVSGEADGGDIYTAVTVVTKENLYKKDIQKLIFSFDR